MAKHIEISENMRDQIGRELPPWTYEVTTTSVRAFARGVGYTDLVYFDDAAARAAGYRGLPAPPTYLGTPVFIPGQSSETTSRPLAGEPSVDIDCGGRLDGAIETEYFERVCAGDPLVAVSRVTDLEVRDSRSLGRMLIVSSETTYTHRDTGRRVAVQRRQWIHY